MIKYIPLSKGLQAAVDEEDYYRVSKYKWYASKSGKGFRAVSDQPGKSTLLHRFILNPSSSMEVDHKDGNSLNCTRNNMRICTHQQNTSSQKAQVFKASMYKGVIWRKDRNKWMARIKYNGRSIYLGLFKLQENAAKEYDKWAVKLFGEFAKLNFKE